MEGKEQNSILEPTGKEIFLVTQHYLFISKLMNLLTFC